MPRYQYQSLTGPVWRAPVAESLSWMPTGPTVTPRTLPAASLALLAASFFTAVFPAYDPASLTWQPNGRHQPAPIVARALESRSVLHPLLPVSYDPAGMQWYVVTPQSRSLVPARLGVTVFDPLGGAFDPAHLAWQPSARAVPRVVPAIRTGSAVLDPFPLGVFFDPASLTWHPSDRVPSRIVAAIRTGSVVQEPLRNFDPSKLQWLPSGRQPWRGLVPNQLGISLLDPFPRALLITVLPLQLEDRSGFLYALLEQSTKRYLVSEQSGIRVVTEEQSQLKQATEERSGPKVEPEDTGT